jgi:DNA repair protein RadC
MTYDILSTRKCRKNINIKHPNDLYNFLKRYAKSRQEMFFVLTLNTAHEIISIHISTIGLLNKSIVHPREVFIHAIKDNAASFMIAHNHPSGQLLPSPEDKEITENLKKASEIMGFIFLDHLIFTKKGFISMKSLEIN